MTRGAVAVHRLSMLLLLLWSVGGGCGCLRRSWQLWVVAGVVGVAQHSAIEQALIGLGACLDAAESSSRVVAVEVVHQQGKPSTAVGL